jgi:hypothetical protein
VIYVGDTIDDNAAFAFAGIHKLVLIGGYDARACSEMMVWQNKKMSGGSSYVCFRQPVLNAALKCPSLEFVMKHTVHSFCSGFCLFVGFPPDASLPDISYSWLASRTPARC